MTVPQGAVDAVTSGGCDVPHRGHRIRGWRHPLRCHDHTCLNNSVHACTSLEISIQEVLTPTRHTNVPNVMNVMPCIFHDSFRASGVMLCLAETPKITRIWLTVGKA